MTCDSAENLVEPYLDDELDASLAAQVRDHLATCHACAETHSRNVALRAAIRTQAPYYKAPAHLRSRVAATLRKANSQATGPWRWMAIAASILLMVSAAWNVAQFESRNSSANQLAQEMVTSHIRSLMGTHLLDVPSSDRHTVKPWFNGKLDFSPEVRDFADRGFPLVGGRLDYVDGRIVAALVYQRRQHIINLFTWPAAGSAGGSEVSRNGYHAIHWSNGGMTYWAVSDLGTSELKQFANLYQ